MIRRKSKLSFTIWEWEWIVKSNDKLSAIGDRDLNTEQPVHLKTEQMVAILNVQFSNGHEKL